MTGLDDTVTTVEAGYEDHAEAVEVAVGGAAPLVLDLRCWGSDRQLGKYCNVLHTNIVQVRLGRLRCFGRPDRTDNLGISITHLLWKYLTNLLFFLYSPPSISYRNALIPPISMLRVL